jgi:hypothetical protein
MAQLASDDEIRRLLILGVDPATAQKGLLKEIALRKIQEQILGSPIGISSGRRGGKSAISIQEIQQAAQQLRTKSKGVGSTIAPVTLTSRDSMYEKGEPMEDLIEQLELDDCRASFDLHHDAFLFECGLGIAGEVVRMSDRHIRPEVVKDMAACHAKHHTGQHENHGDAWSFMVDADPTKGGKVIVQCP